MARVARKSPSYQFSLPKYNPNKGRVQELDVLCVENILTTSYPQESQDMSSRRVPSFYLPPPTSGRRITASVTSLPTEDALKHVHNPPADSYESMCQYLTHIDAIGINYHPNPMDTSVWRASSFYNPPPTSRHWTPTPITSAHPVDTSSRTHNPSQAEDTSIRRVPVLYQTSPTSGHRNTTSTTPLSIVDTSKHVHNPSASSYEPMRQYPTHSDALGVDHQQNPKDTSIRHVPSLVQPPLTSGCRTPTPMTSASPVDMSNRVHNLLHVDHPPKHCVSTGLDATTSIEMYYNLSYGYHDPKRHVPTGFNAPMSIETNYNLSHGYHNTTRRTSTCFDTLPGANVYNTKDTLLRRTTHLPPQDIERRCPQSLLVASTTHHLVVMTRRIDFRRVSMLWWASEHTTSARHGFVNPCG